jgi:hypothetical protein
LIAVLDPSGLVQLQMYPSLIGVPVGAADVPLVPPGDAVVGDVLVLLLDELQATAVVDTSATNATTINQFRARLPPYLICPPDCRRRLEALKCDHSNDFVFSARHETAVEERRYAAMRRGGDAHAIPR